MNENGGIFEKFCRFAISTSKVILFPKIWGKSCLLNDEVIEMVFSKNPNGRRWFALWRVPNQRFSRSGPAAGKMAMRHMASNQNSFSAVMKAGIWWSKKSPTSLRKSAGKLNIVKGSESKQQADVHACGHLIIAGLCLWLQHSCGLISSEKTVSVRCIKFIWFDLQLIRLACIALISNFDDCNYLLRVHPVFVFLNLPKRHRWRRLLERNIQETRRFVTTLKRNDFGNYLNWGLEQLSQFHWLSA